MLKKFKFITHLEIISGFGRKDKIYIYSKILELIGTYCRFLKRFELITSRFYNNEKHFHDFGLIFGQRLNQTNDKINIYFKQLFKNTFDIRICKKLNINFYSNSFNTV